MSGPAWQQIEGGLADELKGFTHLWVRKRALRQTFGLAWILSAAALTRPFGWPHTNTRPMLGRSASPVCADGGRRMPA
eukprot:15454768-Alexandrium_andersonii.AAC.1